MLQIVGVLAVFILSIALSVGIARIAVAEMFRLVRIDTPRNPPM
jgi:hypothetical protein